jgi:hypothetical protein
MAGVLAVAVEPLLMTAHGADRALHADIRRILWNKV